MRITTLIKADGRFIHHPPAGQQYTLEELQSAVGGPIQVLFTKEGNLLIVNEEGKIKDLPVNLVASRISGLMPDDVIVGDALLIDPKLIN